MRVLTYNLSWASQLGVEQGSEADFVAACNAKRTRCFRNAMRSLSELGKQDAVFFQEVELSDVDARTRKVRPA